MLSQKSYDGKDYIAEFYVLYQIMYLKVFDYKHIKVYLATNICLPCNKSYELDL